MEIIKQYKTISILVGLIILFGVLAVFVKVFNIGVSNNGPEIKTSVIVSPTPAATDPFIHAESFNIPSSYMGYLVTKIPNGDLGKNAVAYGTKSATLEGTEWVIKKTNVSDIEYTQIKSLVDSLIQGQLVNKGWKKTLTVNGQKLSPNISNSNNLDSGFVQAADGKFQLAILEGNKDKSGTVQLKLFLSNITNINSL